MLHKNCAARDPHAQCSLGFGDAYLILSLAGRRFAGSSAIRARTPGTNPRGHGLRTVGDSLFSRGDRKSTRLNSSHGYISYAVFCLKKKNRAHSPSVHMLATVLLRS